MQTTAARDWTTDLPNTWGLSTNSWPQPHHVCIGVADTVITDWPEAEMIFQQLEQARWTAFVYFMHSATASRYHHSKVRAPTPSLALQWSMVMKTIMQNLKKQDAAVEPAKATYASGWDLFPWCVHWWCTAFIKLWMCTWWRLFQHRARNGCCLVARLVMIWISCPCVYARRSLSSYLLARPNAHTHKTLFLLPAFFTAHAALWLSSPVWIMALSRLSWSYTNNICQLIYHCSPPVVHSCLFIYALFLHPCLQGENARYLHNWK